MRYEIRALSFAEILDTAFRLLRHHWQVLVGLPALVYVPLAIVQQWIGRQPTSGPEVSLPLLVIGILLLLLLLLVALPFTFAGLVWAIGEVYVGRTPTVGMALREGLRRLVPIVGTTLLYTILIAGAVGLVVGVTGALMFVVSDLRLPIGIVGGVGTVGVGGWLVLAYLLVWPVMLLEGAFGMRALRRSRVLMEGRKWRGFGLTAVAILIAGVLGGILQLAVGMLPYVGAVVASIAQAVGIAYQAAVTNLLYFDARSRVEAFDVEHLAGQVSARAAEAH